MSRLKALFERVDKRIRELIKRPGLHRLEKYFEDLMAELEAGDAEFQAFAAITLRQGWHVFVINYPDISTFTNATYAERFEYLSKMSDLIESMASDKTGKVPAGAVTGAGLSHAYVTALAWNNSALINHFADALDPYNFYAYELVSKKE